MERGKLAKSQSVQRFASRRAARTLMRTLHRAHHLGEIGLERSCSRAAILLPLVAQTIRHDTVRAKRPFQLSIWSDSRVSRIFAMQEERNRLTAFVRSAAAGWPMLAAATLLQLVLLALHALTCSSAPSYAISFHLLATLPVSL